MSLAAIALAGPAARGVEGFFRFFGIDLRAGRGIEWIAALSVLMAVLAFVFMMVMVAWTSQMGQGVMFDLRTRIFSHLQHADIAVFDRTPVGRFHHPSSTLTCSPPLIAIF